MITWIGQELGVRSRRFFGRCCAIRSSGEDPTPTHRNMGRRGSEIRGLLACVEGEDRLAISVIKPDAAAIKRRRLGAKPWRVHQDSATEPARVHHTPRGGSVTLAEPIVLTRFSTRVTATLTDSSVRQTRSGSVRKRGRFKWGASWRTVGDPAAGRGSVEEAVQMPSLGRGWAVRACITPCGH